MSKVYLAKKQIYFLKKELGKVWEKKNLPGSTRAVASRGSLDVDQRRMCPRPSQVRPGVPLKLTLKIWEDSDRGSFLDGFFATNWG